MKLWYSLADMQLLLLCILCSSAGHHTEGMLWIVLLGRRKSGKSSTGNTILGGKAFKKGKQTTKLERSIGCIDSQRVGVVDTPGWSLYGFASEKQVCKEIIRSSLLSCYGSRVFLLTIPVDSFKERDRRALEKHVNLLGDSVWCRAIVLFTWTDLLRGKSIKEHIQQMGEPLQWVLTKCNNRYFVINNRNGYDSPQDVYLLQYIRTNMTATSPGSHMQHRLPIPNPGNNFMGRARAHWSQPVPMDPLDSTEMRNSGRYGRT